MIARICRHAACKLRTDDFAHQNLGMAAFKNHYFRLPRAQRIEHSVRASNAFRFSSTHARGGNFRKVGYGDIPLANENLVSRIMQNSGAASADDVQVRMITESLDQSNNPKRKIEVVPLSTAIRTSIDTEKDLIDISLNQDMPVVKVASLKSLEYKSSKMAAAKKLNTALPEKEFRFRAGIAENDMLRKIDKMSSFLSKGHKCFVQS